MKAENKEELNRIMKEIYENKNTYFIFDNIQDLRDGIRELPLFESNYRAFYKGLRCPKCSLTANVLSHARSWNPGWNCPTCNTPLDARNATNSPHHTLHASPDMGLKRAEIIKAIKNKAVVKGLMNV